MPAAAVAAFGTVAGGIMSSQASKSAAKTQANAINNASAISQQAAADARAEILNRMAPAMSEYVQNLQKVEGTIKSGTIDIMDIFNRSTANASDILAQGGLNAQAALLGGQAMAQGVPRQQFVQNYTQQTGQDIFGNLQTGVISPEAAGLQDVYAGDILMPGSPEYLAQKAAEAEAIAAAGRTSATQQTTQQPASYYERRGLTQPSGRLSMADRLAQRQAEEQATISKAKADLASQGITATVPANETNIPLTGTMASSIADQAQAVTPTTAAGVTLEGAATPAAVMAAEGVQGPSTPMTGTPYIPAQQGTYPTSAPSQQNSAPGYYDATGKLQQGYQTALGQLARGTEVARGDILQGQAGSLGAIAGARGDITSQYNPYLQTGQQALQQEAALSGALGAQAQQAAIDAYIESPGQKYLREQQEKALLRNSAATGGLGGGRVLSALQEQAMGIAATQQQQQLENLRSLASRGQEAVGGYSSAVQGLTGQEVGVRQTASQNLANLSQQLGVNAAQLSQASASELAALSERTGVRLADLQSAQAAAQAQLQTSLGGSLAQTYGSGLADIAALQQAQAQGLYGGTTNIAQLLANLATSSGTQLAGLTAAQGSALAAGTQAAGQTWANTLSGLGNLAGYALNQQQTTTPTTTTLSQPVQNTSYLPYYSNYGSSA